MSSKRFEGLDYNFIDLYQGLLDRDPDLLLICECLSNSSNGDSGTAGRLDVIMRGWTFTTKSAEERSCVKALVFMELYQQKDLARARIEILQLWKGKTLSITESF